MIIIKFKRSNYYYSLLQ